MNADRILSALIGGVITVAILTTVLGRSNTSKVIDASGGAMSKVISAALGAGVTLR
jgi:hypothetical protein